MNTIYSTIKSIRKIYNYKFNIVSLHIISLMLGFFIASVLSTIPTQTGEWGIMSAAIIITTNEIISKIIYSYYKNSRSTVICLINNIKIGIIYGLFVDAFKLGS